MSNEEWEALRELVDDWSIAIKQADKGFCVVFVVEMNISKKVTCKIKFKKAVIIIIIIINIIN